MQINIRNFYHSSGGKISNEGNLQIEKKILDNFNFPKSLKLIKIDTEGHENKVLEGSIKSINKYSPDIILEINEHSFNDSMNLLKEFKYKFYFIDEDKNKITIINKFNKNLIRKEGSNCFATNQEDKKIEKLFNALELS